MSVRPLIVDAVIPARNAAATLAAVIQALPGRRLRGISVVDRASTDATSQIARDLGALVLRAPAGQGAACLAAQEHLAKLPVPPDAVAFIPGDAPKDAARIGDLVGALEAQGAELAIGARAGDGEAGASGPSGRWRRLRGARGPKVSAGERAVVKLIDTVYGHRFLGLGPTRVIKFPALVALGMSDRGGGWDVEMLVRALRLGLTIVEVPIGAEHGSPAPAGRALFHILRHATVR
jgi:glycosyltransferase involved in cell wall biosynthesis